MQKYSCNPENHMESFVTDPARAMPSEWYFGATVFHHCENYGSCLLWANAWTIGSLNQSKPCWMVNQWCVCLCVCGRSWVWLPLSPSNTTFASVFYRDCLWNPLFYFSWTDVFFSYWFFFFFKLVTDFSRMQTQFLLGTGLDKPSQ